MQNWSITVRKRRKQEVPKFFARIHNAKTRIQYKFEFHLSP